MNMKPLKLGVAEVLFSYSKVSKPIRNSKKHCTEVVMLPKSTKVEVRTEKETLYAVASCSTHDTFTYEQGRKIALKKAFSTSRYLSKGERTKIWSDYSKLKKGGRW